MRQQVSNFVSTKKERSYTMNQSTIFKADSRGFADHGWLKATHSFSFANYYDPSRMHFGVLRVLNDDYVEGGMGFPMHPHDNMEIITIPLEGAIEHKDSMGNHSVIKTGDIQVMSAGTGVYHSEFNHYKDVALKLFQIWIMPNKRSVKPRYDQITLDPTERKNKLQQLVSPNAEDAGVWIHQDAWLHLGTFDKDSSFSYTNRKQGNGTYVMIVKGKFDIDGNQLSDRDAIEIMGADPIQMKSLSDDAEILVIDVPMQLN